MPMGIGKEICDNKSLANNNLLIINKICWADPEVSGANAESKAQEILVRLVDLGI
jgi:hypothetical protein